MRKSIVSTLNNNDHNFPMYSDGVAQAVEQVPSNESLVFVRECH
jgi:hypothetical protein